MFKQVILVLLCIYSTYHQSIPQIKPVNTLLYALTDYTLTYFSAKPLSTTSYFEVTLSSSKIIAQNGPNDCTMSLNDISTTPPICSCLNQICRINVNTTSLTNTKIVINIGKLRNPYFTYSQQISVKIYFSSSLTQQNYNITMSPNIYQAMPITNNIFQQSDYGVGITKVTYTFNISLPYIPVNPSLQITVPPEVGFTNINYQISFYGTVQNIGYLQISSLLVFNLIAAGNTQPNGFMIIKISGFTNPQFIGNSSSFILTILETQFMTNCAGCKVAELTSNLFASSNTPGDVQIYSFSSSNLSVSSTTLITVNMRLFAPIPFGGKVSIKLPPTITPSLPIFCDSLFGFVLTAGSTNQVCVFNNAKNSIDTDNFAYPFLVAQGSAILVIQVVNPPDNRPSSFSFETLDPSGRIIGESRDTYVYTAQPLVLSVQVTKSTTTIDTPVQISITIKLGKALASSDQVRVLIPYTANFNFSQTTCISSSLNLNCISTLTTDNMLLISMAPPCVQCGVGSQLSFIVNAYNPSFISSWSQLLTVQTASIYGVIETSDISIGLQVGNLQVNNFSMVGGQFVGSYFNTTITANIPPYVMANGGRIQFYVPENSTYLDISLNSNNIYSFPSQLPANPNSTISYYSNTKPFSVQSIIMPICTSKCTTASQSVTLINLRRGFNNMARCCWKVRVSTVDGWAVAEQSINTTIYSPNKIISTLSLSLNNSVANQFSAYSIAFTSNQIPIDSPLLITLPNTINSITCSITTNFTIGYPINCGVIRPQSVQLTYSGDPTIMMSPFILYTITIANVTNAPSLIPLSYSIVSNFLNGPSQQFYALYALTNPFPISMSVSRSNNTYGASTQLTITINSILNFTKMSIYIPRNIYELTASSINYSPSLNSTHSTIDIYNTTINSIILNGINPSTTAANGDISITTFLNGYISASGKASMPSVLPIYISANLAVNSRLVGSSCSVTITINRVNPTPNEISIVINLPANAFNYNNATYLSSKLNLTMTLPINTTTIVINNLTHLQFIPTNIPPLTITTFDSSNNPVAYANIQVTNVLPNIPAQTILDATRSTSQSNSIATLTLIYTPLFAYTGCIMVIKLPSKQATTTNTTLTNNLLSMSADTINITYTKGSIITITGILNLYPTSDLLSVTLISPDNNVIEQATDLIIPEIQLDVLILTSTIDTNTVSSNCNLVINVSSPKPIAIGSTIQILFDPQLFTKWPSINPSSCTINSQNANCNYATDSNGWLTTLSILSINSNDINLTISLPLTTSWSSYPFANKQIVVGVINSNSNLVSQGKFLMSSLFPFQQSFSPVTIQSANLKPLSMLSSSANSLNISLLLPISTPAPNTILMLSLPTDTFIYTSNTDSTDSNYYYISLNATSTTNSINFIINVTNAIYQKNPSNPISITFSQGGYKVTNPFTISLPKIIPPPLTSINTISRSNYLSNELTTILFPISFDTLITNVTINIIGLAQPILQTISQITIGNTTINNYTSIANSLTINLNNINSPTFVMAISGRNMLLLSKQPQLYNISFSNQTYLFYINNMIQLQQPLIPYSQGLKLTNLNPYVSQNTEIILEGTLPTIFANFILTINSQQYPISSTNVNLSIANMTNPPSISNNILFPLSIANSTHILYQNTLTVIPSLQPLSIPTTIALPTLIYVDTIIQITITFQQPLPTTSFTLTPPSFVNSLVSCDACNGNTCGRAINNCTWRNGQLFMSMSNGNTDKIIYRIKTNKYHSYLPNSTFSLTHQLPTYMYTQQQTIIVRGNPLAVTISLTSWTVNLKSNYTITITPLSSPGRIILAVPKYITNQTNPLTTNPPSIANSDTSTNYTFNATTTTITFNNVNNPPDDRPLTFHVYQDSGTTAQTFGYYRQDIQMTNLDIITILTATRNIAKVAASAQLTLQIQCPPYSDSMYIWLPPSQINFNNSCSIYLGNSQLNCTYLGNNTILTTNQPATNTYTIKNLVNAILSSAPTSNDKVYITIGTPYSKAKTIPSSTLYITPFTTAGAITLLSYQRTTPTRLTFSNIVLSVALEHWTESSAINIVFSPFNYYINQPSIVCSINAQIITSCSKTDDNTIVLTYSSLPSQAFNLSIQNLVNFISDGPQLITSMKKQPDNTYGVLDVYQSITTTNSLTASSQLIRILPPYNYANRQQLIMIAFDTVLPPLPLEKLRVNFTHDSCSQSNLNYNNTISFLCSFATPGLQQFTTSLYHVQYLSQSLATTNSSLTIYPNPITQCSNPSCDLCSIYQATQKCLQCRQRMSSYEGNCVSSCPDGYYSHSESYQCLKCPASCQRCYGPYQNNCLECKDTTAVLDSGTCGLQCSKPILSIVNKQCVVEECGMGGCRVCSDTFCYQCLPQFYGQPFCKSYSLIPPLFLSYFTIPLAMVWMVGLVYCLVRCLGGESIRSWNIYGLSLLQFGIWVLSIALMPNQILSMVLCSLILMKVIICIVGYETYYSRIINQQGERLIDEDNKDDNKEEDKRTQAKKQQQAINIKLKIVKFTSHFLGTDAYHLLRLKIGTVIAYRDNKLFMAMEIATRIVVMCVLGYLITLAIGINDKLILGLMAIICGLAILILRLIDNENVIKCLLRIR